MEFKLKVMVAFVIMVAVASITNGGAARPESLCNMTEKGFSACKPAVTIKGTTLPPKPSVVCCKALARASMSCLCTYKNSKALPALGIDPKLAMQLPKKRGLPIPKKC